MQIVFLRIKFIFYSINITLHTIVRSSAGLRSKVTIPTGTPEVGLPSSSTGMLSVAQITAEPNEATWWTGSPILLDPSNDKVPISWLIAYIFMDPSKEAENNLFPSARDKARMGPAWKALSLVTFTQWMKLQLSPYWHWPNVKFLHTWIWLSFVPSN